MGVEISVHAFIISARDPHELGPLTQGKGFCFVDRASLYNLVNKANLVHSFFSMFIYFLYMFRATMCPSSGAITVFMRHLVIVILYG